MKGFRVLLTLLLLPLYPFIAWSSEERLFVTVECAGALAFIRSGSSEMIPLGGRPHNLAMSPDGRLWVTDGSASRVWIVDPATRKVALLPVRGKQPHGLAVTPDGARVLVASEGDGLLEQFDTAVLKSVATLSLPAPPHNVAVSPDGRTAWLTSPCGRRVLAVEMPGLTLGRSIEVQGQPHDLAFTPDGHRAEAYVPGSLVAIGGSPDPTA